MARNGRTLCTIAMLVVVAMAGNAEATNVTGNFSVDNAFQFYISTDDTVLGGTPPGTPVGTGADWTVTQTLTGTLTPGVTNYLHVAAQDFGGPEMFIGDFTLSDSAFRFANGTSLLLTNTTEWTVRQGSFAGANDPLVDLGSNGNPIWGVRGGISGGAHHIWDANAQTDPASVFFSAVVIPTQPTGAVPEPSTLSLFGLGLLGARWMRRRRPA